MLIFCENMNIIQNFFCDIGLSIRMKKMTNYAYVVVEYDHSTISDRNHPVYNSVNGFGFDTNALLFLYFFCGMAC